MALMSRRTSLFSNLPFPTPRLYSFRAVMASVRIQRRRTRVKGFRLRLSVPRVHVKFLNFLQVVRSVKSLFGRAMAALRKGANEEVCARQKYCVGRWESNVFYTEAIADCLEFIKRSASLQVEPDKKARLVP